MAGQEVPQSHEQLAGVSAIVVRQRRADIIPQHVPYFLGAVRLMDQVLRQRGRSNFGNMLVLCDSQDLGFVQLAHGNAIFERDHP